MLGLRKLCSLCKRERDCWILPKTKRSITVRAELVFWRHRCSSDSSVPLRCLQEYQVVDQPTPDTGTFEELLDLAVPRSEPEGSE